MNETNDEFLPRVLISQLGFFGPYPARYKEIAAPVMPEVDALQQTVAKAGGPERYRNTLTHYINEKDLGFLFSFMKIDPRDRPSARELLQHLWFQDT
jgi:hypothetical protein